MNQRLREELEQIREVDQALRGEAMETAGKHGRSSPEYQALRERALKIEEVHRARLVAIVNEHGWPGASLVGETAASGAFLVLQHADPGFQKNYLPLVRAAADANELPPSWLPLLEDRVLLYDGKNQIYGTQITQTKDGKPTLWPIDDEAHVDERRARVGLEPLATYLKRFGIVYEGGASKD